LHPEGEVKIFKDPNIDNLLLDTVGRNNVRTFKGKVDHVVIPTNSPLLGQVREFDVEHEHIAESPDIIKAVFDPAMLNYGGIDLNQINVNRVGKIINVQFDPAQLNELEQSNFKGFTPVITGFQYIQSPFPLLGINEPAQKSEVLVKT